MVPQNVRIAARLVVRLAPWRYTDEAQHADEDEERHGVQQEEERERLWVCRAGDRSRDETAKRDAEVHRHALLRERRMPALGRCEGAQQRRLAGPEGTAAGADQDVENQRMPGRPNQREQREGRRHHDQRRCEHGPRSHAIREGTADEARAQRCRGVRRDDQPGEPERDAAHVVQVDDQERPDDAVPEHIREAPGLEDPDVARQVWVQAPKVGPHAASLSAPLRGSAWDRNAA